jgi:hypothetical protein
VGQRAQFVGVQEHLRRLRSSVSSAYYIQYQLDYSVRSRPRGTQYVAQISFSPYKEVYRSSRTLNDDDWIPGNTKDKAGRNGSRMK